MATEKRLIIYADDLIKCLKKHDRRIPGIPWSITGIQNILKELKPVDAVEVKNGRWEPREDVKGFVRCSVCHDCNIYDDWADGKKWNYCPNCGAKMDGDGNA